MAMIVTPLSLSLLLSLSFSLSYQLCLDVGFLALETVRISMARTVVLFIAMTLMAVMMVAVTVRAVLASRSSRHQIPSCLFRETHSKALLCSTQGCKPCAKPKHWHWLEHIIFMPFSKFIPVFVCASVFLSGCGSIYLTVWVSLFSPWGFCRYTMFLIASFAVRYIYKDHKLSKCSYGSACVNIFFFLPVCVCARLCEPTYVCGWFRLCKPSTQPSVTKGPPCSEANHLLPTASRFLAPLSNNGLARQTHFHTLRMTTSASCSCQQAHAQT